MPIKSLTLWRGTHSPSLLSLIGEAWSEATLLVVCPPHLNDFSFLRFLLSRAFQGGLRLEGEWDAEARAWLQSALDRMDEAPPLEWPRSPVLGVFTSGTVSGAPRLVFYSKENIEFSLQAIRALFDTSLIKQIFCYPQPTHTFGLTLGYVHAHRHGLKLLTGSGKYSRSFHEQWLRTVDRHTLTLGTPVHFHDLIEHCERVGKSPEASYTCIVGGAKVPLDLWIRLHSRLHIQAPSIGYGATEASPGLAHLPPGCRPTEDGEIGAFFAGIKTKLIPGQGLEFSGPNACLAYLQNEHVHFPKSIMIRDALKQRPDGTLVFEGRTELTLNRGGAKISLEAADELLRKQLGINAQCVCLPDARLGEELGVVVGANTVSQDRIFSLLRHAFEQNFRSDYFLELPKLPLTPSSKVDRKECARLLELKLHETSRPYVRP